MSAAPFPVRSAAIRGCKDWVPRQDVVPTRGLGRNPSGFSAAVSPTDPQTVWVEGFDQDAQDNRARHVWRSVDGGRHFWSVLDGADVLYLAYGTPFGGTDLYRYDDVHE